MKIDKMSKVWLNVINPFWNLIKVFYKSFVNLTKHNGIEHSGYIAFLMIFSLFPFMIFFTSILGLLGETIVGLQFIELIQNIIPSDMADALMPRISEISTGPSPSILSIAFLTIIWTASSFIAGLRTILNKSYHVKTTPNFLLGRMLSILHFFLITITIIVAILSLIVVPKAIHQINILLGYYYEPNCFWIFVRHLTMFLVLVFMVALIYCLIPNVKLSLRKVLPGSIVTVIGWYLTVKLFALYLLYFNQFNVIYGSLGGVIISLLFFYLISMILIYGAEFNYNFERRKIHE
jgi:membrane protein